MRKNITIAFSLSVLLFLSVSAYAAPGAYFSGSLGVAMLGDTDMTFPPTDNLIAQTKNAIETNFDGTYDVEYGYNAESETGTALGFALGVGLTNNFRLEAEIAYQKNDVDKATYSYSHDIQFDDGEDVISSQFEDSDEDVVSGETSSLAFMFNVYYDFINDSAVTPFMSAGVGLAKVKYDINSEFIYNAMGKLDDDYNLVSLDDSGDTEVLAYQLGAGIAYAVSDIVTIDFKYRYFVTEDPEFDDVEMEYSSHNFSVGVRFGF